MKRKLTLGEHKELGSQLRWLRQNLQKASTKIANAKGVSAEVLARDFPNLEREELLDGYYANNRTSPVLTRK